MEARLEGANMEKEKFQAYIVLAIVSILLIFSVTTTLKMQRLSASFDQATGGSSSTDTSQGESYEAMMSRMHPDQVIPKSSGTNTGPSMVGGC